MCCVVFMFSYRYVGELMIVKIKASTTYMRASRYVIGWEGGAWGRPAPRRQYASGRRAPRTLHGGTRTSGLLPGERHANLAAAAASRGRRPTRR